MKKNAYTDLSKPSFGKLNQSRILTVVGLGVSLLNPFFGLIPIIFGFYQVYTDKRQSAPTYRKVDYQFALFSLIAAGLYTFLMVFKIFL